MHSKRTIFGGLIVAGRVAGLLLILLALLSFPQLQFLTGHYQPLFQLMGSIALLLIGGLWLGGISALIHFFDQSLSQN